MMNIELKNTQKKILYIFIGNIAVHSGVTQKIRNTISAFKKNKTDFTLFSLSENVSEAGFISDKEYLLPYNYITNKLLLYKELNLFLLQNVNYDICLFRYPLASKELVDFLKLHPNKIIFEHNTKEYPEIKQEAKVWVKKFKFKLTPSYFKLLLKTYCQPLYTEYYYGKQVLHLAKKGIAVTNEIAEYEKSRVSNYECSVISNGINVNDTPFFERTLAANQTLYLLLLASHAVDWHGVDLILDSFNKYSLNNIKLILIGSFSNETNQIALKNKNIELYGFLPKDKISTYLKLAHVGLGSFALHRKDLEEASTLKVREYLASGLPVFIGHKDTDIEKSTEFKKITLMVDLRRQEINWNEVYNWALKLYDEKDINTLIRDEALLKIDFSKKVEEMLHL